MSQTRQVNLSLSPRAIAIVGITIIALGGIIYVTPKIISYFSIRNALAQVQTLESRGQFQGALNILASTTGEWTTSSVQNDIVLLKQKEERYLGWQNDYNMALADMASSSYDGAQTLLQNIDSSYPQYNLVKDKLIEVQKSVQDTLNMKLKAAQQNAAAQKAAADAAQQKAEDAAQNAAYSASQAAAATAMKAFVNQLRNINANFINNCSGNAVKAIQAYSSGQDTGVYLGAAVSACNGAEADAKNLDNSYSNMPTAYVGAVHAMEWVSYYYAQSLLSFTQSDYQTAKYDLDLADPYEAQVSLFLQSN